VAVFVSSGVLEFIFGPKHINLRLNNASETEAARL
jgi:hypothetical protein